MTHMKCYLDTNILIYYIFEASLYFEKARNLILSLRVDEYFLYISPLTIDEFSYQLDLLSRYDDKKRKDLYELLEIMMSTVLSLPRLHIVNPPTTKDKQYEVINLMEKYNLKPRDAYHLLTMIENDIEYIATYDKDFNKVIKSGIIKKY